MKRFFPMHEGIKPDTTEFVEIPIDEFAETISWALIHLGEAVDSLQHDADKNVSNHTDLHNRIVDIEDALRPTKDNESVAPEPYETRLSPYAHKLTCNLVHPIETMKPEACSCGTHSDDCNVNEYPDWLGNETFNAFCDCGYLNTTEQETPDTQPSMTSTTNTWSNVSSWLTPTWNTDNAGTKGADITKTPETKTPVHYSYCNAYKNPTLGDCTCDATGHQDYCVHLIDPYMACNCEFTFDDPMDAKYAKEIDTPPPAWYTGETQGGDMYLDSNETLKATIRKLEADVAEAYRRLDQQQQTIDDHNQYLATDFNRILQNTRYIADTQKLVHQLDRNLAADIVDNIILDAKVKDNTDRLDNLAKQDGAPEQRQNDRLDALEQHFNNKHHSMNWRDL